MSFTYRIKSFSTPSKNGKNNGGNNVVSRQAMRSSQKRSFDDIDLENVDFDFKERGLLNQKRVNKNASKEEEKKEERVEKRIENVRSHNNKRKGGEEEQSQSPSKKKGKAPLAKRSAEPREEEERKEPLRFPPKKGHHLRRILDPIVLAETRRFAEENEVEEEWFTDACQLGTFTFLESVCSFPDNTKDILNPPKIKANPDAMNLKRREDSLRLLIKKYEVELEKQKELIEHYSEQPQETSIQPAPQESKIPRLNATKGRRSLQSKEDELSTEDEHSREKVFEATQKASFQIDEIRKILERKAQRIENTNKSFINIVEILRQESFKEFNLEEDPRNLIREVTEFSEELSFTSKSLFEDEYPHNMDQLIATSEGFLND